MFRKIGDAWERNKLMRVCICAGIAVIVVILTPLNKNPISWIFWAIVAAFWASQPRDIRRQMRRSALLVLGCLVFFPIVIWLKGSKAIGPVKIEPFGRRRDRWGRELKWWED